MIFDSHFHLLPREVTGVASFYNEAWADIEGHLRAMDAAGVDKALVSYPTTDYHFKRAVPEAEAAREINALTAKMFKRHRDRFAWLAVVPLTTPTPMLKEAGYALDEGAAGFSMPTNNSDVYPDDPRFMEFFEDIQKSGRPVFFHPTTQTPFGHMELRHPLITPVFQYAFDTSICLSRVVVSGMLRKLPKLKVVFASFGGVMPFLAVRFDRTYKMLLPRGYVKDMGEDPGETLRRVYVDTSGSASEPLLKLALEVFGEDRLLWGSDYPANREIEASIDAVRNLDIKEEAKGKILNKNLSSLFYEP